MKRQTNFSAEDTETAKCSKKFLRLKLAFGKHSILCIEEIIAVRLFLPLLKRASREGGTGGSWVIPLDDQANRLLISSGIFARIITRINFRRQIAMRDNSLCRIGVFYDGSYFSYACRHFYINTELGWLQFRPFHTLLETFIRTREQRYERCRVVYSAWFQGMFSSREAAPRQLKNERNLLHDLMHAGIEPKYMPMPKTGKNEKGSDVALAVDAMQIGLAGKIDIAVLVTGDSDFVPLARALMKEGLRVMGAYFEYDVNGDKSFIKERLANGCNYTLNINEAQKERDLKALFKGLFYKVGGSETEKSVAAVEV